MEDTRALIERLVEKHLETLRGVAIRIHTLCVEMDPAGRDGAAAIALAHKLAHQIAGSAGSIGFSEIGITARALEDQLRPLVEEQHPMDADRAALIRALAERLDAVVSKQSPGASTLLERELSRARPQADLAFRR